MQRRNDAFGAGHGDMPHTQPGLGAEPGKDHLVIAPERAFHEQRIGAAYAGAYLRSEIGTGGQKDQPMLPVCDVEPDRLALLAGRCSA